MTTPCEEDEEAARRAELIEFLSHACAWCPSDDLTYVENFETSEQIRWRGRKVS